MAVDLVPEALWLEGAGFCNFDVHSLGFGSGFRVRFRVYGVFKEGPPSYHLGYIMDKHGFKFKKM